jgi:zinc transporter 5/7
LICEGPHSSPISWHIAPSPILLELPIQRALPALDMSTGGPSLSVDLTPPVNGHHNHGHIRRGHSRSNRWAQPPPPIPQSVNSLPQPETNGVNSSYSYGHAHQLSNGHTNWHSSDHHDHHDQSHAHHDHGHHHDHDHHDHGHGHHGHHGHTHSVSSVHNGALHNNDSKSAHGFISVDTTIKADSSPDQMYVSWMLLRKQ